MAPPGVSNPNPNPNPNSRYDELPRWELCLNNPCCRRPLPPFRANVPVYFVHFLFN